jgi:hypothetical protein
MGIEVYWDDEAKTILRYDFEGRWTWDEFYKRCNKVIAMKAESLRRIDLMLDMRGSKYIPSDGIHHVQQITRLYSDGIGISVFVSDNHFFHTVFDVGVKLHSNLRDRYWLVETPDAARKIISEVRQLKMT